MILISEMRILPREFWQTAGKSKLTIDVISLSMWSRSNRPLPGDKPKHPRIQYESFIFSRNISAHCFVVGFSKFPFVSFSNSWFVEAREKTWFHIFMMYYILRGSAETFLYNSYRRSSVMVVKSTSAVTTHLSLPILYSKVSILGFYPCRRYHSVKGKLIDWNDWNFCFVQSFEFYKQSQSVKKFNTRVLATNISFDPRFVVIKRVKIFAMSCMWCAVMP